MQKLVDKILSFRGDEWRPFAIEVSQDEIRLAVYGGVRGFDEPATAETASHDDLESCLLEGIVLLEQSPLLSPSRAPYYRMPHHRCVFFKAFRSAESSAVFRLRRLMRAVPCKGERVRFTSRNAEFLQEICIEEVCWDLHDDEVHLWSSQQGLSEDEFENLVSSHREAGWERASEFKLKLNPETKKNP